MKKKLFTLMTLLLCLCSGAWATEGPTSGTIYKFQTKSSLTNNTSITDNPVSITTSNYLQTLTGNDGCALSAHNSNSKFQISNNGMKLADKSYSYLILNLGGWTLKAGDVIKTIITGQNCKLYKANTTDDNDKILDITKSSNNTTYQTFTVTSDVSATTLYLKASSNSPIIYYFEVIRPTTITLDATTNGGTVSSSTIKTADEKVVLPHAFKSGYKFKGWYTAPTGGTKQDDYYTVSGAVTLYAQFEDLPTSGTMFSFEIEDALKPAADVTIKNSAGFASTQDMIQYATIEGGSAIASNSSTSSHIIITTTPTLKFAGSNGCLTINLESPLQVGDKITTTISSQNIAYTATNARNTTYTFTKGNNQTLTLAEGNVLVDQSTIYLWAAGSSNGELKSLTITRPVNYTIQYKLGAAIGGTAPTETNKEEGETFEVAAAPGDLVAPSGKEFKCWNDGTSDYNPGDTYTVGTSNVTLTAVYQNITVKYNVTYDLGDATAGTAPTQESLAEGAQFAVAAAPGDLEAPSGKKFSTWNDGSADYAPGDTYTMGTSDVTLTAQYVNVYATTKGTHANGDFTIDKATAAEGETVTLTATPNVRYLFDSWNVYKTGDPETTVTVTNNQFTMPAYPVTVDATFVTDTRKQILYLTTTSASDTKSNDKLYKALNSVDDYNVVIEAPASQTVTDYDLVVLHESLDGKTMYNNTVVAAAKSGNVPVLNTKTYFYSEGRWGWGTPDAGKSVNGATLNAAYSNTSSHPIFDGVTISEGFVEIIGTAADKAMQPVAPVSGKEGYLLATTPKSDNTPLTAIHELTPAQRGVSSAKYLLISVSSAKLNDLTENGQKLFKNAAAYLINNSASWTPTVAVTKRNDRTYGTFVTTKALDFTNVTDMEAYIATGLNGTSTAVTIEKVTKVPANTPIIVKTAEKTTASVNVPITSSATAADVEGNLLVAGDGTTAWNGTAGYTYYYLASDQFHKGTSGTLQTGKAYLKVSGDPNSAKAMTLFIGEGETTGINGVEEVAPVTKTRKVVKNGRLVIETANGEYTVSGARVK